MGSLEKLLYFSAQTPSDKIPIAGQKIAYNHLLELSENYDVFLVFFCDKRELQYISETDYSFCKSVKYIYLSGFKKNLRRLLFFYKPVKFNSRIDNKLKKELIEMIRAEKIRMCHFEFTSIINYIDAIGYLIEYAQTVEHDVTFQSFQRKFKNSKNILLKSFLFFEYTRIKKNELKWLKKFNKIYVLNLKDKKILKKHHVNNCEIKYPKIDNSLKNLKREVVPFSIGFVGAMHREENEDAVIKFINDVLPKLREEFHLIKFYVVGSNPSKKITSISNFNKNVIVTGFVEDLKDYYKFLDISVVPLLAGAGIKIKTLESLKAGIPTFATDVGYEGIDESTENLHRVKDFEDMYLKIKDFFNKNYS